MRHLGAEIEASGFQVESSHTQKVGNSSVKVGLRTSGHEMTFCEVYSYEMKWVSSPVYSSRFAMTPQAIQAREYGCPGAANGNPQWPPNLASGVESRYAGARNRHPKH